MALFEVYRHPVFKLYKTSLFSKAVVLQIAIFFLTYIPPLFVVYRSYGFWVRENYYREVPDIKFKHELLVSLQYTDRNTKAGHFVTWSTLQNYNQLFQGSDESFTVPFLKSNEVDLNGNGKYDHLDLSLEISVPDAADVHTVQLLLVFQYKLYKFVTLTMESLAFIEYSSGVPGGGLKTLGELRFKQRQTLAHRGTDKRYIDPVLSPTSVNVEDFQIFNIIKNYTTRNVTTIYTNAYNVWETGRAAGQPFVITAQVQYPEDVYLYTPGFWFLIKWGWVQYISVLFIFLFVFMRIKRFIFSNQLVHTIVQQPVGEHMKLQ